MLPWMLRNNGIYACVTHKTKAMRTDQVVKKRKRLQTTLSQFGENFLLHRHETKTLSEVVQNLHFNGKASGRFKLQRQLLEADLRR